MSARKVVTIPERLLADVIKVAERMGVPYLALIERILSGVIPILRYKKDLLDSLALVDAFDDIRRLGGIVIPERVIRELLPAMGSERIEELCEELGRLAAWFGELGRAKRSVTAGELKNALSLWIPSATVDVIREGDGGVFKFVLSLNSPSKELVKLSSCIAEGLVRGYDIREYEIGAGNSVLTIRVSGVYEE